MRVPSFLYIVATMLALTAGCSKKNEVDPQSSGEGTATIQLTHNGQVITDYKSEKTAGVGGGSYLIDISSADGKHALALTIDGESPGTYPFINPTQTVTKGKADFLYLSEALPELYAGTGTPGTLLPDTGEVIVKTATRTRCSGSFKGTGKNGKDGKTYTLEGTFDARIF